MTGVVNSEFEPVVTIAADGRDWKAVIDAGFNGDLELPEAPRSFVNPRPRGLAESVLGRQTIQKELFEVDFVFDEQLQIAEATFVAGSEILLGTHLLQHHKLTIDFPAQIVVLERGR